MLESCEGKAVAKGLCAKHYRRQRRAGDPGRVRKAGRKRSPQRLLMEEMEVGTRPRTFTRYVQAMEMLRETCDKEEMAQFITASLRPNCTLNVSKLHEIGFKRYVVRVGQVSKSEAQGLWKFWKSTH